MCGPTAEIVHNTQPYPPYIPPPAQEPSTILIKNACIVDGTGAARYTADALVHNGIIAALGSSAAPEFARLHSQSQEPGRTLTIDATGLVLSPGFIDMHAHSDLHLLTHPSHVPKLTQGVTTEVVGQDGIAYAPVTPAALAQIRKQIAGWNGNPARAPAFWPPAAGAEFWQWRSVREYLDTLDRFGTATNVAFLVPQGNLRMIAAGMEPGKATPEQIARMKALLREGLDEGAVGMSSGLTYTPGMYADEEELRELCAVLAEKVVQGAGGYKYVPYYAPHTRSYGLDVLGAYDEMLRISAATGAPVHLTHAVLNFPANRGLAPTFLATIEKHLEEGLDVTLDTYPYLPGSTTLSAMLPSWALAGGHEATLERLRGDAGADVLERIRRDVVHDGTDGCHGLPVDFSTIEIGGINSPAGKEDAFLTSLTGKRIDEAASSIQQDSLQGQQGLGDPFSLFVHILVKDDLATTILQHVGYEGNVRMIMKSRVHMGGSDGILTPAKPHPRVWATMPRYVGFYGRDIFNASAANHVVGPDGTPEIPPSEEFPAPFNQKTALEELIPHLTSRPARRLGMLFDPATGSESTQEGVPRRVPRGIVKEGYAADLVLFNPETVAALATFAEPSQASKDIPWVFVNGKVAVQQGKVTGSRGGRTVRLRQGGVW